MMRARAGKCWILSLAIANVVAACGGDEPKDGSTQANAAGESGNDDGPSQGAAGAPTSVGDGGAAGIVEMGDSAGAMASGGVDTAGAGAGGEAIGGASTQNPNTVRGRVLTGRLPRPGITVLLDGVLAKTDTDGWFTVEDAAEEYELILLETGSRSLRIYDSLRTREPIVHFGSFPPALPNTATLRGKVLGGASPPVAKNVTTRVIYRSERRGELASVTVKPPAAFELQPKWTDAAPEDNGEILVVQTVDDANGAPLEYTGFGRRAVHFASGDVVGSTEGSALTDVQLTGVEETSPVSGTITVPSGWTLSSSQLRVGPWWTPAGISGPGAFRVEYPQLDLPWRIVLTFSGAGGARSLMNWTIPASASKDVELEVPKPLRLLTPPDKATEITYDTIFSWESPPGYVVTLLANYATWHVEHVTMASSATLYDLRPLFGTPLFGYDGVWALSAIGPATTMDDVLVADDSRWMDGEAPSLDLGSETRSFKEAAFVPP